MANIEKQVVVATAEQIATLIRIYRSAVASGDKSLRRATVQNLAKHGIQAAFLANPPSSVPVTDLEKTSSGQNKEVKEVLNDGC